MSNKEIEPNNITIQRFDILRLFRLLLLQSKMFIVIFVVLSSISIYVYKSTQPIYKIESLLQVEGDQNSLGGLSSANMLFPPAGTNLDNLTTLYKSRINTSNVIKKLNFNIVFYENEKELYNVVDIETFKDFNYIPRNFSYFNINFNQLGYTLSSEKDNYIIKAQYGEIYEDKNLRVKINDVPDTLKDKTYVMRFSSINDAINNLQSRINIKVITDTKSFYGSKAGLIEASINASNIKKGIDIVNAFNETFITKNIEYNNQKAMRAISFIDDRLEAIDGVLDINKTNLKNFQQDNSSLDVDLEVQQIIENISKIQSEINRLNIEITKAEAIYTSNNPIYINLQKQRYVLY